MWIVTTVWSDGPVPGFNSMVALGAAAFGEGQDASFLGMASPISEHFDPAFLQRYNITRTEQLSRPAPSKVMTAFVQWVANLAPKGNCVLVSANATHDWAFISYYCAMTNTPNPFKEAKDIGDIFSGLVRNMTAKHSWKALRTKSNLHTAVDWARATSVGLMRVAERAGLVLPGYNPKKKASVLISDDPNAVVPDSLEVGGTDRVQQAFKVPGVPEEEPKKKYKRYVKKRKPGRPKVVKRGRPPKPPKRGRPTKEEVAKRERAARRAAKKAAQETEQK